MTQSELKELKAIGAELGAAKAENERLRGLLREVRVLLTNSSYKISGTAAFLSSIDAALSRQADHVRDAAQMMVPSEILKAIAWGDRDDAAEAIGSLRCLLADPEGEDEIAFPDSPEPTDTYTAVDMATAAAQGFRDGQAAVEQAPAPGELWAVHAQGPDELYAAFSRADAEQHAAALNALPMPDDIHVSAVVIVSPWSAAEHWKYLAEQEREHATDLRAIATRPAQTEQPEQINIDPLLNAGAALSNIAFNLAQRPGVTLDQHVCDLLSSARKRWDAARAALSDQGGEE